MRLTAAAWGVSVGSVARALRLTPEQRQAVRQGKRPLSCRAITDGSAVIAPGG